MADSSFSIQQAAEEAGDAVFLVDQEREWTFAAVASAVADLSSELTAGSHASAFESDRVGVQFALTGQHGVRESIALLALFELGASCVLLHPRWPDPQQRDVLLRCGEPVFLDELVSRVQRPAGGSRSSPRSSSGAQTPTERFELVLFTSGSSGQPKGVRLSQRAFSHAVEASAARLDWQQHDRWLCSLPFAHVGGLSVLLRTLAARKTLVLDNSSSFRASGFVELVEQRAVTLASVVPTMLHRVVASDLQCPSSLRVLLVGGARASAGLLERASELGWPCLVTYGMTEACSQIATQDPAQSRGQIERGVVGKPLPGVEVRILDAAGGVAAACADGRIQVRGPTLFSGYLGASDLDEPPRSSDEWFDTGDRGRLNELGELTVLGRGDDLIISGGENVSAASVGERLESHPEIAEACVLALDDAEWGQSVGAVIAVVAGPPDEEEFEAFLRTEFAPFERPKRWRFVDELPETAAGKADIAACQRLIQDRPGG